MRRGPKHFVRSHAVLRALAVATTVLALFAHAAQSRVAAGDPPAPAAAAAEKKLPEQLIPLDPKGKIGRAHV